MHNDLTGQADYVHFHRRDRGGRRAFYFRQDLHDYQDILIFVFPEEKQKV